MVRAKEVYREAAVLKSFKTAVFLRIRQYRENDAVLLLCLCRQVHLLR